jgi:[ribosomal protein S5]-alanine N-acetyltransferase
VGGKDKIAKKNCAIRPLAHGLLFSMTAFIETPRLALRKWKDTDLAPFIKMNADEEVMAFFPALMSELETIQMVDRIKSFFEETGFGLWAVEKKDTGAFIGFVGLSIPRFEADFTPCVEIGWRLARSHWGMGLAAEAAFACLDYGFRKLGLSEIVSFTAAINTRSIGVMHKIGMHFTKNFTHPSLPEDSRLNPHVLYKITGKQFFSAPTAGT